jgi:hypothetical protein
MSEEKQYIIDLFNNSVINGDHYRFNNLAVIFPYLIDPEINVEFFPAIKSKKSCNNVYTGNTAWVKYENFKGLLLALFEAYSDFDKDRFIKKISNERNGLQLDSYFKETIAEIYPVVEYYDKISNVNTFIDYIKNDDAAFKEYLLESRVLKYMFIDPGFNSYRVNHDLVLMIAKLHNDEGSKKQQESFYKNFSSRFLNSYKQNETIMTELMKNSLFKYRYAKKMI